MDLHELMRILINSGFITTVGGPIFLYYFIAKLREKITLSWYAFVPLLQAYMLTGIYFALFGSRIVTAHLQTFLYLFLGSHVLTTMFCIIIFLTKSEEAPRRTVPFNLKYAAAAFALYASGLGGGLALFYGLIINDSCDGARCESAQLLAGRIGFTGALSFPAISIGLAATWLNFLCYIYRPPVSPHQEK